MSPRKRKDPRMEWLPSRVYLTDYGYHFHPKAGGKVRIAPPDASKSAVLRAYEEYVQEHDSTTFAALADKFLASDQFKDRQARTQKDYMTMTNTLKKVFGRVHVDDIEPIHIRQFMDIKGQKAKVSANRHKAVLSAIFSWGYERGLVKSNPVKGVRAFTEKARERYIEDWEYKLIYEHASDVLKAFMEISYLCAARKSDVLSLQRQALKPEGVYIRQGKSGVRQIKSWTDRLRNAVNLGLSTPSSQPTMFVIHTRTGTKLTASGLRVHWNNAWEKALNEVATLEHFTLHDLKAKGISDFEGSLSDKQNFSGHKTASQVAVYDRKVKVTPTLDPEETIK